MGSNHKGNNLKVQKGPSIQLLPINTIQSAEQPDKIQRNWTRWVKVCSKDFRMDRGHSREDRKRWEAEADQGDSGWSGIQG